MTEHQVMSWLPKHHSHKRDFVSHPVAALQLRHGLSIELNGTRLLENMLSRRHLQAFGRTL